MSKLNIVIDAIDKMLMILPAKFPRITSLLIKEISFI
jgi:hypothetical protein